MAVVWVIVLMTLTGCWSGGPSTSDAWSMTDEELDSISFFTTHHYTRDFNFILEADSLLLLDGMPGGAGGDTAKVVRGDRIVVADILTLRADSVDSVWVKVARDQWAQGWVHESALLMAAAPDDPISRFIMFFSDVHLIALLAILAIVGATYGLRRLMRRNAFIVHLRDIDSPFPMLLAILVALSATVYASIQLLAPESWRHFYYHPSLNPFALPFHLGLLVSTVWAMGVVLLAAIDDVFRKLPVAGALVYMLGLAAVCALNYVVFSLLTMYLVGYPLLILYIVMVVRRYIGWDACPMACGHCGAPLKERGVCPHCGAVND